MMNRLEVETSRLQSAAAIVAGVIMVPLGIGAMVTGLAGGGGMVPVAIGVMMLATFGVVVWLGRRAHARSVRYFSDEGLERNDGTRLPWADLERVIYQVRVVNGQKKLWRTEIRFSEDRAAWLLPLRVRNGRDVSGFVGALPCEHAEKNV
jgi:hypothetical protein